jgi:hypothetical protein
MVHRLAPGEIASGVFRRMAGRPAITAAEKAELAAFLAAPTAKLIPSAPTPPGGALGLMRRILSAPHADPGSDLGPHPRQSVNVENRVPAQKTMSYEMEMMRNRVIMAHLAGSPTYDRWDAVLNAERPYPRPIIEGGKK